MMLWVDVGWFLRLFKLCKLSVFQSTWRLRLGVADIKAGKKPKQKAESMEQ